MGRDEEAEPLYREATEATHRLLGEDHLFSVVAMNNLGYLLCGLGNSEEGERYLRRSIEFARRIQGTDSESGLPATANLGEMLLDRGELEEAEPLLLESASGLLEDASPPEQRELLGADPVATAARRVVELYEAWHAADAAVGYDLQAAEWRERALELAR